MTATEGGQSLEELCPREGSGTHTHTLTTEYVRSQEVIGALEKNKAREEVMRFYLRWSRKSSERVRE